MSKKYVKKILKDYKDWLNNNHAGMYLKISDYSLNKYIKEQLTTSDIVEQSEHLVCDCPNENWVYDESGVDMYCKKCAKKEAN